MKIKHFELEKLETNLVPFSIQFLNGYGPFRARRAWGQDGFIFNALALQKSFISSSRCSWTVWFYFQFTLLMKLFHFELAELEANLDPSSIHLPMKMTNSEPEALEANLGWCQNTPLMKMIHVKLVTLEACSVLFSNHFLNEHHPLCTRGAPGKFGLISNTLP